MPDEKVIAQLRYDFLMAVFAELRTLAGSAAGHSQAALQDETDPARKEDLAAIHTLSQGLLDRIANYPSLKPDCWTAEIVFWPRYDIWPSTNLIVGFAKLLLEKSGGPIDEAQRLALIRIRESGEAIHRVTAQFTEVLRIEKRRTDMSMGRLDEADLDEVDLRKIIEEFVSLSRGPVEVKARGPEILPKVWTDYAASWALYYIAAALSGNFSQGKIVFTVDCNSDTAAMTLENDAFALSVSVLEEFKRVSAAATLFACRRFDEALALCIGQAIVETHGGKLWVGSRAGGGSLAAFTLPVMKR